MQFFLGHDTKVNLMYYIYKRQIIYEIFTIKSPCVL